jgi:hypothetical protein
MHYQVLPQVSSGEPKCKVQEQAGWYRRIGVAYASPPRGPLSPKKYVKKVIFFISQI